MKQGDVLKVVNIEPLEGNTVAPPLRLEELVRIKDIYVCECGQEHVDAGLVSKYNYIRCHACKKEIPNGESIHWCHPSRFVN